MRITPPELRTSLQHGRCCRITNAPNIRHGAALARLLSSSAARNQRVLHFTRRPHPWPIQALEIDSRLCASGNIRKRFQHIGNAVRHSGQDVEESKSSASQQSPLANSIQNSNICRAAEDQEQERNDCHDDSPASNSADLHRHGNLVAGSKIEAIDLLHPHTLSRKLKGFLGTPDRSWVVFPVYPSTASNHIFSSVAPGLGLEYYPGVHDGNSRQCRSFLAKTERTISLKEWPISLDDNLKACLTDDLLDGLYKDLASCTHSPYLKEALDCHWRFLMTACRGQVDAIPSLSLRDPDDLQTSASDQTNQGCRQQRISLKNDLYNIEVTRSFSSGPSSFQDTLAIVMLNYCQQIHEALKHANNTGFCFEGMDWVPAEFMSRAQRALSCVPLHTGMKN